MKRFLVITFAAFLAAITLLYLINARLRDRAVATTGRDLAARAQLVALTYDRTLQTRLNEAFTFSALPSLRGFTISDDDSRPARMAAAQFELRAIVSADPVIRAAAIVDHKGKVLLSSDDSMNADWSNRAYVREGLLGHPSASAPAHEAEESVQYYASPIIDNFGNIGGVLVLRVLAQEIWDALIYTPNVVVVDENGVRIANSFTPQQLFTALAPLSNDVMARVTEDKLYGAEVPEIRVVPFPELSAQLRLRRVTQTVLRDPSGVSYLVAIQPLESNPWSVVLLARDDALGFVNAGNLETLGLGALGGLLFAVIVYFALK